MMNSLKDVFISYGRFNQYELEPSRLVSLLLVGVIPLSWMGWLSLRNGQQAATDLAMELSQQMNQGIQQTIETDLERSYSFSRSVAIASKYGILDINDLDALQTYILRQFRLSDSSIENVYVGTEKGDFVHFSMDGKALKLELMDSQTDGQLISYQIDAQGNRTTQSVNQQYDPKVRPWYRNTVFPEPAHFAAPYFSGASQELGFTLAKPVYDAADSFQGVAGVDVSLTPLQQRLKAIDQEMTLQVVILESSGELLASSSATPLVLANNVGLRVNAVDSEDSTISAAAQALMERFSSLEKIDEQEALTLSIDNQEYILHVNPIGRDLGLDWLMLSLIPQSEILDKIQTNARITSAVVAISIALSGALCIYVYRTIKLAADV